LKSLALPRGARVSSNINSLEKGLGKTRCITFQGVSGSPPKPQRDHGTPDVGGSIPDAVALWAIHTHVGWTAALAYMTESERSGAVLMLWYGMDKKAESRTSGALTGCASWWLPSRRLPIWRGAKIIWECAVGTCQMTEALKVADVARVYSSDSVDRGYPQASCPLGNHNCSNLDLIVANPLATGPPRRSLRADWRGSLTTRPWHYCCRLISAAA
jgi:hypothetical protein